MTEIAREAGGLLMKFFQEHVKVEYKGEVDLVTVADFVPVAANDADTGFKFRCAADDCVFAYVNHSGKFTIEDLKKSETANTVIKTGSASVQVNQVNRLVIWVRGQQLDLWLNGTPLASVTIRPAPPSAADSTSATSFFIENWDKTADSVNLQRFYVFQPG